MNADLGDKELTARIISVFYRVYNKLGRGFAGKLYENALAIELTRDGLPARQQCPASVHYDEHLVGERVADIVVGDKVLIEIKACARLDSAHEAQILNYLKATGIEVGLLVNFGPEIKFQRFAFAP